MSHDSRKDSRCDICRNVLLLGRINILRAQEPHVEGRAREAKPDARTEHPAKVGSTARMPSKVTHAAGVTRLRYRILRVHSYMRV